MSATQKRRSARIPGFEWNPRTQTARFVVYEPKTRRKKRLTLHDVGSRDDAIALWSKFKARVKERARRSSIIAPTFEEFVTQYFDDIRSQVRPHTADSYAYTIHTHLVPEFGQVRLSELTAGMVNRWSARLVSDGYAGATVNGYVNTLRLLLGYALKWDVIDELPIKKPLDKYAVNLPCNELSLEEERRFLASFDDEPGFRAWLADHMPRGTTREVAEDAGGRFGRKRVYGASLRPDSDAAGAYYERFRDAKPLFVVAVETGLRRGDLLALTWRAVDLEAGTIEVVTGKTRRKAYLPISDRCREALLACRERRHHHDRVFVARDGAPLAEKTVIRYFAIAKEIAGFANRPLRFHDLRHTYGSKLAREGVNLEFIADAMAHSSTRMTRRYARPGSTALAAVARALNEAASRDLPAESGRTKS